MPIGKFEINNIYNVDCLAGMKELPSECIDLIVTSPPYDDLRNYNGYSFDFENIAKEIYCVVKKGGVVVWVVGDKIKNGDRTLTSFRQCIYFQKVGFNVHDIMIYQKKTRRLCVPMLIQIVMNLCLCFLKKKFILLIR